jgi:ribokinase/sulfofructose kinase
VWVAPDGERLLACHNPCLRSMRLDEADCALISQAQVLFLSSFVPLKLLRETIGLRTSGLSIAFDLTDTFDDLAARGLGREDFWRLLPGIDLLMTNHLGLTSLMGIDGPEAAFNAVRQRAPGVHVAMTMGARGAWLGLDDLEVCVDAFPVQALDTTGAGDAFHAGLIYGLLLEKWSLSRAGIFASALAALNCTGLGARGGLVSRDTVLQFLHDKSENW